MRGAGLEVQAEPKITEASLELLETVSNQPRQLFRQSQGPAANALFAANYHLPIKLSQLRIDVMQHLPDPGPGILSVSDATSGKILAIMLILLTGVFLAYAHSACASGLSLIYVILRKHKDDENLLEWEERTEADEVGTPSASEPEAPSSEKEVDAGGSESKDEAGGG